MHVRTYVHIHNFGFSGAIPVSSSDIGLSSIDMSSSVYSLECSGSSSNCTVDLAGVCTRSTSAAVICQGLY